MTLLRWADAERFLEKPDARTPVVLLFGDDPGLVAERAGALARSVTGSGDDPFAVTRLESDAVALDPGRLSDEARAGSLFGGTRAVRVRVAGYRPILPALEPLLEDPPRGCFVILEAGDLKKTAPLRRRCESARTGVAIACFADTCRDLDRLIER